VDRGIGGKLHNNGRRWYYLQKERILPGILEGVRRYSEGFPSYVVSTACLEARRILKEKGNSSLRKGHIIEAAIERALALHKLPPLRAKRSKAVTKLMKTQRIGSYMERVEKYIGGLVSSEPSVHREALRVVNNGVREKLCCCGYSPLSVAITIIYRVAYPRYSQKMVEEMARKRFNAGSAESVTPLLRILFPEFRPGRAGLDGECKLEVGERALNPRAFSLKEE
jgi:hypothetical protein